MQELENGKTQTSLRVSGETRKLIETAAFLDGTRPTVDDVVHQAVEEYVRRQQAS